MLHRAHNLCDQGEPIANGYHPNHVDRIISTYEHQNSINEEAENRCDTMCVPYVRGPSDLLWKQLSNERVKHIFKKGRTLQQFLFNGEPKKWARKKNVF